MNSNSTLIDFIKNLLEEKKVIKFSEFMEIALYKPKLGYYNSNNEILGKYGDFVTSPEISPVFAECFAECFAEILDNFKKDNLKNSVIIEFGAGSGNFMVDCLKYLKSINSLPQKYIIIELSSFFKEKQKDNLKKNLPSLVNNVEWLNEIPENLESAIIFANEVLDAMPFTMFKKSKGEIKELGVSFNREKDNFYFNEMEANKDLILKVKDIEKEVGILEDEYISEINLWAYPWLKSLDYIAKHSVIILCDYGYSRKDYYRKERTKGTIRCYHNHKANENPFLNIGFQDITSHIDFTFIAENALNIGFNLEGFLTQGEFLTLNNMEKVFLKRLNNCKDNFEKLKLSNSVKPLIMNGDMGDMFKVLVFSKDFKGYLNCFKLSNKLNRL